MATSIAGRVRSASPSHHRGGALAIDMRRIANLLRDPPMAMGAAGDASMNTSMCSSPQSAWEPGDRGAAPMGSARNCHHVVMQHQISVLTERVNTSIAGLQRQSEAERRRILQLERKLESRLEDKVRDGDGRERWAEIQGSVSGLIEETQALTRRVESLDERLWARTSGSELTKQRNRELEQQVQLLEQQTRLGQSAFDETHKRQAAKLRRVEHSLEEAQRRLVKVEEEVRPIQHGAHHRDSYLEARVANMEHQQERMGNDLRALQEMQFDDHFLGTATVAPQDEGVLDEARAGLEDAVQSIERGLSSLDKKVSSQVEEVASSLASLRVKVDGQLQRVGTLAERLETAHEPALESLRLELGQARQQDRREAEAEFSSLRHRMQEATEASDDAMAEIREALRQTAAQIAAFSLRPEELPALHSLDDRLTLQEQEVCAVRTRLDSITGLAEGTDAIGGKLPEVQEDELDDLRRRLEWLEEEQSAASAPNERMDRRQAQNSICDLVQGVSRLKQQVSSQESAHSAMALQVQQLQGQFERRWSDDAAVHHVSVEVEAKVREVWEKVAELHARLLEVEGGLDFTRVNDTGNVEVELGHPDQGAGGVSCASAAPAAEMKEKLEAVARHLEGMDVLSDRVTEMERRLQQTSLLSPLPVKNTEVSFGGDVAMKDTVACALEDVKVSLRAHAEGQERLAGKLKEVSQASDANGRALDKVQKEVAAACSDVQATKDLFQQIQKTAPEGHQEPDSDSYDLLVVRLSKLEERLELFEGHASPKAGATDGDLAVREKVQEEVSKLRAKASEELSKLAQLQESLGAARLSVEALEQRESTASDAQTKAQAQALALKDLQEQVNDACQQLRLTSDATNAVKRDVEQLHSQRKVGISAGLGGGSDGGSSLATVNNRIDILSAQLAELQKSRSSHRGHSSQSPPQGSRSPPVSRDASLNFSLTEQTEKPAGEGSLNFSLTESRKDLSISEPAACITGTTSSLQATTNQHAEMKDTKNLVGVAGRSNDVLDSLLVKKKGGQSGNLDCPDKRTGGDILDSLVVESSSSTNGRPRPTPLKLEIEERSGPLATVAEESSDAGEQSYESHRSLGRPRNKTPLSSKSPPSVLHSESPSNSGSLDNSRSNLDASVSCQEASVGHEVSIGHDYSVEDSQELDKCDFVEAVKPKSLPKVSARAGRVNVLPEKAETIDAPSSTDANANASLEGAAGTGEKDKGTDEDNEYAESFDEENASGSVPESINESVSGSGGNAWDDGEDV